MRISPLAIALALLIVLPPIGARAHPGNTDSSGCHTCKTNCPKWGLDYGEYHCHASKGVPQPNEPVRSIRNNAGTGVTVPAPEYKTKVVPTAEKVKALPVSKQKEVAPVKAAEVKESSNTKVGTPPDLNKQEKRGGFSRFIYWVF